MLFGTLLLLVPALMTGHPFIYWDTPTFYSWGHDIVAAVERPWPPLSSFPAHRGLWAADNMPGAWDTITPEQFQLVLTSIGSRSKFYAVPLYLLGAEFELWIPTIAQSALTAGMVWIVYVTVTQRERPAEYVALVAALTLLTSVPFFAAFLSPDIFAPLGILAAVMLLCCYARLTRPRRVACAVMLCLATLAHLSDFAILLGVLATVLMLAWGIGSPERLRAGVLVFAAAAACALCLAALSDAGLEAIFGEPVRPSPFVEGRVIADGPGETYLREVCGDRHFQACRYKDLKVTTTDDIIWPDLSWHNLPLITDPSERRQFLDEQAAVVLGTLERHPIAQVVASLRNIARQLADFRISNDIGASLTGLLEAHSDRTMRVQQIVPHLKRCRRDPSACDYSGVLRPLQEGQYVVCALSLLFIAFEMRRSNRIGAFGSADKRRASVTLVVAILAGVAYNAAVCGALSGPWPRYQARVIWLVPMLAALLALDLLASKRHPGATGSKSLPQAGLLA